jgi:hypothetical protein
MLTFFDVDARKIMFLSLVYRIADRMNPVKEEAR